MPVNGSLPILGDLTNKISIDDLVDNLTTNDATKPLTAAQGVALKALIDAGGGIDALVEGDLVNNLTTNDATKPLTATQGVALKSLFDNIDALEAADLINNLTTDDATKPLTAAQGVALKALIDAIDISGGGSGRGAQTITTPSGVVELDLEIFETFIIDVTTDDDISLTIKTGTIGSFFLVIDKGDNATGTVSFPVEWDSVGLESINYQQEYTRHLISGVSFSGDVSAKYHGNSSTLPPLAYANEVVMLGDFGEVERDHNETGNYVVARNPDLVEVIGDNGYNVGTFAEVSSAMAILDPLIALEKVVGVTGNHDNEREDPAPSTSTSILNLNAQAGWKVLSLANGEARPANWKTLGFDDSLWPDHTSIFSYGESTGTDDDTVDFGGDTNDKDPLYLCRHVLNVDTSTITSGAALYCTYVADGGCTIRVNGIEVIHYNRVFTDGSWPDGDLGAIVTAGATQVGSGFGFETNIYRFYLPASILVNGDNIITAEVYQELQTTGLVTSSDMRFGLGMAWTTDLPAFRTHGYGSGFLQYMPYITELDGGNTGACYTTQVGEIKYHHLDSGWDSSQDVTHPSFCTEDSFQAEWLRQNIDPTTINFVVIHHSPVSLSSSRGYSELNWLTDVVGLHGLFVGHDHQDYLIEDVDTGFIVVGTSLVGRANRANNGLQTTAAGNWVIQKTHDNTDPSIITCVTSANDGEGGLGYKIEKIRSSAPDQGNIIYTFQKRI